MLSRYVFLLGMFVISSCTLSDMIIVSDKTNTSSIDQTSILNTGSQTYQYPFAEIFTGSTDTYNPIFKGIEKKAIRINHTSGKPTIIDFINSEAKSVEVSITFPTASGANLRWSQVISPDGTMDGPFGRKIGYNLKQFGGYQFIFNENMMAGDPWSGEADITLTLRNTPYDTDVLILD